MTATVTDRQTTGQRPTNRGRPQRESFRNRARGGVLGAIDRHTAPIFLAPALIGILVIDGIPVVYGVVISFQNLSLSNASTKFVGIDNYVNAFSDPGTWQSIGLSLVFTFASVAAAFVLGMVAALLLNAPIFGRGVMRALLIIPWAVPAFVAALTWGWMLNDQFGVINRILSVLGVDHPPVWLSAQYAMVSIIIVMVWKSFPFQMIFILAGLQSIPTELYEAAKTDGASVFARFRHITLPLLRPISAISVLMAAINTFQDFTIPFILTGGGPGEATNLITIGSYNLAFRAGNVSEGATLASIMFLIILIGVSVYLWRYVRQIGRP